MYSYNVSGCPSLSLTDDMLNLITISSTASVITQRWNAPRYFLKLNSIELFSYQSIYYFPLPELICVIFGYEEKKRHKCCSRTALGNFPVFFGRLYTHKNADWKVIQRIFGKGHILNEDLTALIKHRLLQKGFMTGHDYSFSSVRQQIHKQTHLSLTDRQQRWDTFSLQISIR